MRHLLREPLVHFFALGVGLFIFNGIWQAHVDKDTYTVRVSADELARQAVIFASENQRSPTDDDLRALLFSHVEEEALKREALRLGLDEDDVIIRRRLAQKMRFMLTDATLQDTPPETELRAWFEGNKELFKEEELRSFSHIYLSPEKYGDDIYTAAAELSKTITDDNWRSLGDPFIAQRQYPNMSKGQITRDFGQTFANGVFDQEEGTWSEPVGSALGLHLVRVDRITAPKEATFEDKRSEIETVWRERMQREANQEALADLLEKYEVVVDGLDEDLIQ